MLTALDDPADPTSIGRSALALLDELARFSAPGPGVTRLPFTAEHEQALQAIERRMRAAGLEVHRDAAATLIGRRDGPAGAPTLLLGSHQDSIRNGGRYDGILGVVLPILALELLRDRELPFAIEVLAFADEEGVRFPTALLGPRCLAGTFDPAVLQLCDRDGISLGDALTAFGGEPATLPTLARDPADTLGYLELHIEQGPVLERADLALGVVSGICGIERRTVTLNGEAAHAGTTPMALRRDALAGAAEVVLSVERICTDTDGLVGVIGTMSLAPGVVNAVPASATFTIELRAADDAIRERATDTVTDAIARVADARGLTVSDRRSYAQAGRPCDPALQSILADGVRAVGTEPVTLVSGATHDASAMADLCPMGMLFLRCRGGISHHPDEAVTAADCGAAVSALVAAMEGLAANKAAPPGDLTRSWGAERR